MDTAGPRLKYLSRAAPVVDPYFTRIDSGGADYVRATPAPHSHLSPQSRFFFNKNVMHSFYVKVFANNGFIFNDNSLENFADACCNGAAYMRRQLVIWGDCVKLNYGSRPEDSPVLWRRMSSYVQQSALAFHGLRVDNCHSTPLPVLQHMAVVARAQRPDIILIGELFTGSNEKDIEFVRKCGLNLLIRDAMFK
jgi:glycogen debranching enzyme